jgi:hypothetical protein
MKPEQNKRFKKTVNYAFKRYIGITLLIIALTAQVLSATASPYPYRPDPTQGQIFTDPDGNTTKLLGRYDVVREFNNGRAAVMFVDILNREQWGFIDINGNVIISFGEYDEIRDYSNGLSAVRRGNQWGYIDVNGNVIVALGAYNTIGNYNNERAVVVINGVYGVIDTNGQTIIPFGRFDLVDDFHNGFAAVKQGVRWGYIDTIGNIVVPLVYEYAKPVGEGGTAWVLYDNKWGLLGMYQFVRTAPNPVVIESDIFIEPYESSVIADIQTWLNTTFNSRLTVNGIYDSPTRTALIRGVQSAIGQPVNGVFTAETRAAIPSLRLDATNNPPRLVQLLKAALILNGYSLPWMATGTYDQQTFQAVRNFQQSNGLVVDGIAGRNTFERLLR